jgi:molybdopterin/thiamine biosynthesis adenylyltransferase
MSAELISRNPDLARLRHEGLDVLIASGHLLIRDVPYVNAQGAVARGTLVSVLTLAGDDTTRPETHVAYFIGDHPCHVGGSIIAGIVHSSKKVKLADRIVIDHTFSAKLRGGYKDHYHKLMTYIAIITGPAVQRDPAATASTYPPIPTETADSPFEYHDTASSRSGITASSEKLAIGKLGIVGLGGTGGYVLDQVAKTPVEEIHLYDGDRLHTHNAFRAPGAASIEQLRSAPSKVDYFAELYSPMRRRIEGHPVYLDESNVELLANLDFVFLCVGDGEKKEVIAEALNEYDITFIDVGMSVDTGGGSLGGLLRITTSTPANREQLRYHDRIPYSEEGPETEYEQNIQVADLNALNAVLAVIKWKKLMGFYRDLEGEHHSVYTIDGNTLDNEDRDE